jgi:hypothetical protein
VKELAEFIIDQDKQKEEVVTKSTQDLHGDLGTKNSSKNGGGLSSQRKAPIWTSTKQSMSYLTISGIESELSRPIVEWPKEIMIQLIGNAWDSLQDNYLNGTKDTRKIEVRIKIDSILDGCVRRPVIRIAVRNSNVDNLPVFEDVEQIFDYTKFHSTKRNQHRMVTGALGDFLKRILGMGYACWTEDYDKERKDSAAAADKQWPKPVIIRHNGEEEWVYLHVEWDKQEYWPNMIHSIEMDAPKFTEVQVTLPLDLILRNLGGDMNRGISHILNDMKNYFYRNTIGKTNTEFTFEIEDNGEGESESY